MNGFLSFVKKEALHILRDPVTMLIALLLPVIEVLLFGFAISTEVNNINIAVVIPHPTETTRKIVTRIESNPYFTLKGSIPENQIDKTLRSGEADAVLVFAKDYDQCVTNMEQGTPVKPFIQIIMDASNTNTATAGAGYLQNILTAGMIKTSIPETHLLFNPQMKSAYNFVPGIMGLIFILICAILTSISIVREKETGTMEVLLVSPVQPIWIILAKMIPYFIISCLNLVSILFLTRYILNVPISGSLAGIIGISLLYLVLALALGLFISTVAKTQVRALLISARLMFMPMIMFSGMVFPIENMPDVLQIISCIVPARWYIDAIRKLMIEGLPFSEVLHHFLILTSMTILLIGVALKKFKNRLE